MDLAPTLDPDSDSDFAVDHPHSPFKKPKHSQDDLPVGSGSSSVMKGHVGEADPIKSSPSQDTDDYDDDDVISEDDYFDEDDDAVDYDVYEDCDDDDKNTSENDGYTTMQSQFDNMDLPPGVEASFSWPTYPLVKETVTQTKTLTVSDLPVASMKESSSICQTAHAESSASSSKARAETSTNGGVEGIREINVMNIPRFDVVESLSDHHFSTSGFKDSQPPKNWAKKIQDEWKILTNDLPETIFVRVCEARMDLLRAVIAGPSGTPYHDGLFTFDCLFPTDYPSSPPEVYYYSGGLRLNPNLYECGKVCLSLLGTWEGHQNEKWISGKSTMLQVLVSIQALILNEHPFFNEPGYDRFTGPEGENKSRRYNEDVFLLSLKTMLYTMRRPPKHFEDLVAQHFRDRARNILSACKAYMEDVLVGCDIEGPRVQNETKAVGAKEFKAKLTPMIKLLISGFTRNGSSDCEEFRVTAP